jgi:hypothetical protein
VTQDEDGGEAESVERRGERAPAALPSSPHWLGVPRCKSPVDQLASTHHAARPSEYRLPNRCAPAADLSVAKLRPAGPAARTSFRMRPVSSTAQIEVASSDTSNPAKYLIAPPFRCLWRSDNRPRLSSRKEQPFLGRLPRPQSPHLSPKARGCGHRAVATNGKQPERGDP